MRSLAFLFLVFLSSVFPAVGDAERQVMCYIPAPGLELGAMHAAFALEYYSSNFSSFEWSWKFIGGPTGTSNEAVSAFVLNGSDCTFMIGPGYSYLAIALSAVVEMPWIETSASTGLLSAEQQPYFNRVIPTDDVGAENMAKAMRGLGWARAHILCVEEPFALSYSRAISEKLVDVGGGPDLSECFGLQASEDSLNSFLDRVLAHPNRVLLVVSLNSISTFTNLLNVMERRKLHESLIILWAESVCSTNDKDYLRVPGTLCMAYSPDVPLFHDFSAAYRARDPAKEVAALEAIRIKGINTTMTDVYAALAHDATLHMMTVLEFRKRSGNGTSMSELLRIMTTDGATGVVDLNDASGNRINANMVVLNTLENGTEVSVGQSVGGRFSWNVETRGVYVLNGTFSIDELPAGSSDAAAAADESISVSIIAICVAAFLVALIVGVTTAKVWSSNHRDNRRAPKDDSKSIAIVFTDIQGSTALWTIDPESMSFAIGQHHDEIRRNIANFGGYEVKTVGDSFMVAFDNALDATEFAMAVQEGLYSLKWKDLFDRYYKRVASEDNIGGSCGSDPSRSEEQLYRSQWNGLRVRIGVHFGPCRVHLDPVTLGYDYFGTAVNIAARVETIGHGGQTLLSEAVLSELGDVLSNHDIRVKSLGPQSLAGIDEPVTIFELLPSSLSHRKFAPLRLGHDITDIVLLDDVVEPTPCHGNDHEANTTDVTAYEGELAVGVPAGLEEAYSLSKHIGGSQSRIEVTHRLADFHNFFKVLLSTLTKDDRPRLMRALCAHWGVQYPKGLTYYTDPQRFDSLLLSVVYKAFKVYEASFRLSVREHRRSQHSGAPTPMTFKLHPVKVSTFQATSTPTESSSRGSSVISTTYLPPTPKRFNPEQGSDAVQ